MKTSLIIPFKDEVEYVATTMQTAHTYLSNHGVDFELVAVDDSTDGTWEFLQSFASSHPNVVVVRGGEPPGYGTALQTGFRVARGEILIPFNGDLSDSLDDVLSYIRLMEDGYDMVFGSRYMVGANVIGSTVLKRIVSRLGNGFLQLLFLTSCSDITNSFKAYRKDILEAINPTATGYNFVMETALKGIRQKHNYTTIPVTWTGREYGLSKMSIVQSVPKYLSTAFRIRFFGTLVPLATRGK